MIPLIFDHITRKGTLQKEPATMENTTIDSETASNLTNDLSLSGKRRSKSLPTAGVKSRGVAPKKPKIHPQGAHQRSVDDRLCVIPPHKDDSSALSILECIDKYFNRHKNEIKIKLHNWAQQKTVSGVRLIQNNRFEIFLKAKGKDFAAFAKLVEEIQKEEGYGTALTGRTVEDIRSIIINYAQGQAQKDPRISVSPYEFDNFSFLVNFEACDAQFPHIDLLYPNFQCGLCLTDKSPATITYEIDHPIKNAIHLKKYAWKDMSPSLLKAMQEDAECRDLLQSFGDTLTNNLREVKHAGSLARGSLVTLPGGVIHAGPKVSGFRCILFFSAWPTTSQVASYNPDTQYFQSMLCADIYFLLHSQLPSQDRVYLLNLLAGMLRKYKNLYRHLNDDSMKKFCRALAYAQYPQGGRDVLIRVFAETGEVAAKGAVIPGNLVQSKRDIKPKLISVSGLQTEFNGDSYDMELYRLPNNPERVAIYYPCDDTWEGRKATDCYKLIWKGRSTSNKLFDGRNGTLLSTDGEEIKCFLGK